MRRIVPLSPIVPVLSLGLCVACGSTDSDDERSDGGTGGQSESGGAGTGGGSTGATSGGGAANGGSGGDEQEGTGGDEQEGTGGDAETGGSGPGGDSSGGAGGEDAMGTGGSSPTDCSYSTEPTAATAARSAGFAGTDEQYAELYDAPCTDDPDCLEPCTSRGGTEAFCAGSECIHSTTDYCLPPTKWRLVREVLSESASIDEAAVTSLSFDDGTDHDRLVLEKFLFAIPEDATVQGISVHVRHGAEGPNDTKDQAIRLMKGGVVGEEDRSRPDLWPLTLSEVDYGGETDSWGETWTPEAINADDFGVVIAALPVDGGGRAYVDFVSVVVHYSAPCED